MPALTTAPTNPAQVLLRADARRQQRPADRSGRRRRRRCRSPRRSAGATRSARGRARRARAARSAQRRQGDIERPGGDPQRVLAPRRARGHRRRQPAITAQARARRRPRRSPRGRDRGRHGDGHRGAGRGRSRPSPVTAGSTPRRAPRRRRPISSGKDHGPADTATTSDRDQDRRGDGAQLEAAGPAAQRTRKRRSAVRGAGTRAIACSRSPLAKSGHSVSVNTSSA